MFPSAREMNIPRQVGTEAPAPPRADGARIHAVAEIAPAFANALWNHDHRHIPRDSPKSVSFHDKSRQGHTVAVFVQHPTAERGGRLIVCANTKRYLNSNGNICSSFGLQQEHIQVMRSELSIYGDIADHYSIIIMNRQSNVAPPNGTPADNKRFNSAMKIFAHRVHAEVECLSYKTHYGYAGEISCSKIACTTCQDYFQNSNQFIEMTSDVAYNDGRSRTQNPANWESPDVPHRTEFRVVPQVVRDLFDSYLTCDSIFTESSLLAQSLNLDIHTLSILDVPLNNAEYPQLAILRGEFENGIFASHRFRELCPALESHHDICYTCPSADIDIDSPQSLPTISDISPPWDMARRMAIGAALVGAVAGAAAFARSIISMTQ